MQSYVLESISIKNQPIPALEERPLSHPHSARLWGPWVGLFCITLQRVSASYGENKENEHFLDASLCQVPHLSQLTLFMAP